MSADAELVQIVDAASADAARRSGTWLHCRPGCTQCCVGVFAISQLDAVRLREGLRALQVEDPVRAAALRVRIGEAVERLSANFPGDLLTGILDEQREDFEDFANDAVCPVLDPSTGMCDLYAYRPMTCRVFGPPVRSDDGVGVCELNFVGASDGEILAAELKIDWTGLEDQLCMETEEATGVHGATLIAFALAKETERAIYCDR